MWNFVRNIQEGSPKIHVGQKISTRHEGEVIVFWSLHFSFGPTDQYYSFKAAFSLVVNPSPPTHLPASTLTKKYNANV